MVADLAYDVAAGGNRAYVADEVGGLRILDVSDPTRPYELGGIDSTEIVVETAIAKDSFAYIGWDQPPFLRTVDVTDPRNPKTAGGCRIVNPPADVVLRDSLLYVAQAFRFQVVNVARPREPALVGSCTIGDMTTCGLALWDTFAYVNAIPGLWILSIANPAAPRVIDTAGGRRLNAIGVAVRDTVAFIPSAYDTLWVISVADPAAIRYIAGVPLGANTLGVDAVVVEDTLVYVGTAYNVTAVNVKVLQHPFVVGTCPTPTYTRRVAYQQPYVYAACSEGGVLILDSVHTAISEAPSTRPPAASCLSATPNPTRGQLWLSGTGFGTTTVYVRDAAGRLVGMQRSTPDSGGTAAVLDLSRLASGVYFIEARSPTGRAGTARIIRP